MLQISEDNNNTKNESNVNSDCNRCTHKDVCKYAEKADQAIRIFHDIPIFIVDIECKKLSKGIYNINSRGE